MVLAEALLAENESDDASTTPAPKPASPQKTTATPKPAAAPVV